MSTSSGHGDLAQQQQAASPQGWPVWMLWSYPKTQRGFPGAVLVLLALLPAVPLLWCWLRDGYDGLGPVRFELSDVVLTVLFQCCVLSLTRLLWVNILLATLVLWTLPLDGYSLMRYGGVISPTMFDVLFETNKQEAWEYVQGEFVSGLLVWGLISLIGISAAWMAWRKQLRMSWASVCRSLLVLLVAVAAVLGGKFLSGVSVQRSCSGTVGLGFLVRAMVAMEERADVQGLIATRSVDACEFENLDQSTTEANIIFVIWFGESAKRTHWQIYDYGRETTPELYKRREQLICFDRIVACGPLTMQALPPVLTDVPAHHKNEQARTTSFLPLLQAAGYHTAWYSNQGAHGAWDGLVASYASEAEYVRWFNHAPLQSERGNHLCYDDVLVDALSDRLQAHEGPACFVLHGMGSHFRYEYRVPPAQRHFLTTAPPVDYHGDAQNIIDAYDDSIRYTDALIGRLLCELEQRTEPVVFLYLGDHGELLRSDACHGRLGHGAWNDVHSGELAVPAVFWANSVWRQGHADCWRHLQAHRQSLHSARDWFQTIVHLAGLRGGPCDARRSLAAAAYEPGPVQFVDVGGSVCDYPADLCDSPDK